MFLKVLECIHSVAEPKYFYEPLLLIFWINPELLLRPWGSSIYILTLVLILLFKYIVKKIKKRKFLY
jgi:hypothetical protein